MQERSPAADGWREEFFEFFDAQGFGSHQRRYIGVAERGQEESAYLRLGSLAMGFIRAAALKSLQSFIAFEA
jgi:hypothetical protein